MADVRSAAAVREKAEEIYAACLRGELAHWRYGDSPLDDVAARVVRVIRELHADPTAIPYHSRWRHFGVGGVDRVAMFDAHLLGRTPDERLAARVDLVITSVLLDAGAGDRWSYRDPETQATFARSEGLAVASYDLFTSGAFSSDPEGAPLRADAAGLSRLDAGELAHAFQVTASNPLVGIDGRAALLRRLGGVVAAAPQFAHPRDPSAPRRLGHLALHLRDRAQGKELPAPAILEALLDALGPIWPSRDTAAGHLAGDVWLHRQFGVVPFHKLSQWLSYSLCEPLEWDGLRITHLDDLTGLAEYRNGGLFVDGGVLAPRERGALEREHDVGSELVIEWRALTVALLDRLAAQIRSQLGLQPRDLPLARVLEGGTWRAGRAIAAERRASGASPLRVRSDGTVF